MDDIPNTVFFFGEDNTHRTIASFKEDLSRSHKAEIDATLKIAANIRREGNHIEQVVLLSNITIFTNVNDKLAEFDGVVLSVNDKRKEIVVSLIESKLQRKGAKSEARSSLGLKLSKLSSIQVCKHGGAKSDMLGRIGVAWAHWRLSYS